MAGIAHEGIDKMLLADGRAIGGGVLLLPYVGLAVARSTDALRSQAQRGIGSREVVLRQFLAVQTNGGLEREVADAVTGPHVRQQIVVDVLGYALLEVVDGVSRLVTDGEVGILEGVVEIIASVCVVDADNGGHQQRIDKAVGDAGRVGRRVEDLLFGGGQSFLLRAAVGGIDAKFQAFLQLPFHVRMEVVAFEP